MAKVQYILSDSTKCFSDAGTTQITDGTPLYQCANNGPCLNFAGAAYCTIGGTFPSSGTVMSISASVTA